MKRVLFSLFSDRDRASRARASFRNVRGRVLRDEPRLHEGSVDPLLAAELSGTPEQGRLTSSVVSRFGVLFGIALGFGIWVDLTFDLPALVGTMTLGSIGILIGSIAVLLTARPPLESALSNVSRSLAEGDVLLTVPVDVADIEATSRRIESCGGRVVFAA